MSFKANAFVNAFGKVKMVHEMRGRPYRQKIIKMNFADKFGLDK